MNHHEMVALVKELSGEEDVEVLDVLPAEAQYDGRVLHPHKVIRVGGRYLAEMVEHPGEWWIGERTSDGRLYVWGSYGPLDQAAAQH